MMVQCDLLSGDQVGRPYVKLGHLLVERIGLVILMVGPNRRPTIGGPKVDWGFSRAKIDYWKSLRKVIGWRTYL